MESMDATYLTEEIIGAGVYTGGEGAMESGAPELCGVLVVANDPVVLWQDIALAPPGLWFWPDRPPAELADAVLVVPPGESHRRELR